MFCHECGAPLPDTASFCGQCGAKVEPNDMPTGSGLPGTAETPAHQQAKPERSSAVAKAAPTGIMGALGSPQAKAAVTASPTPHVARPCRSRLVPIAAAVAIAAVVAGAGFAGFHAMGASQVAGFSGAAQSAQATDAGGQESDEDALGDEIQPESSEAIDAKRLQADLEADAQFMAGQADRTFVDDAPYSIGSVTEPDRAEADGKLTAKATVELSNEFFKETDDVTFTYSLSDEGKWTLEGKDVQNVKIEPLRGISQDDDRGVQGTSPDFDAKTGTCTVKTNVSQKKWYGTVSGGSTITYKFVDRGWTFDKADGEPKLSGAKAVEGSYIDLRAGAATKQAFARFEVRDVDEKTGSCKVIWHWHSNFYARKGMATEVQDSAGGEADGQIKMTSDGAAIEFGRSLEGGLKVGEINGMIWLEDDPGTITVKANLEVSTLDDRTNNMLMYDRHDIMVRDSATMMLDRK